MHSFRYLIFFIFVTFLAYSGSIGCGTTGGFTFIINPQGPTVVTKGSTLQFSTDPGGLAVTWSVFGGAANGTIDQNGLYTPPAVLPVESRVTIVAKLDSQEATALVDLRTGDQITFGQPEQVSDTVTSSTVLNFGIVGGGLSSRIAAREGSHQVFVAWTGLGDPPNTDPTDIFFSQSTDLGPFSPQRNLTSGFGDSHSFNAILVDLNLNPGIFYSLNDGINFRLPLGPATFLGSTNQGSTFNNPVEIDAGPIFQYNADGAVDEQNRYQVVYVEGDPSPSPSVHPQVQYTRSSDSGTNWTEPVPIFPEMENQFFPNIAITPDGQDLYVCYQDGARLFDTFMSPTNIKLVGSEDGGNSFSFINDVTANGIFDGFCTMAVGPNDEIYIAYSSKSLVLPTDPFDVKFVRSLDGGNTFFPPVSFNDLTGKDSTFINFLAVDSLGRIGIVFSAPNDVQIPKEVYFARSDDNGASFSQIETIAQADNGGFTLGLGIDFDDAGRTFIVYGDGPDTDNIDIFVVMGE